MTNDNGAAETKKVTLSIRYAIPGLMAILIILAVGLTGWLAFRSGVQAVEILATRLGLEVSNRIEEHVQSFMEIPHIFHQINQAYNIGFEIKHKNIKIEHENYNVNLQD